MTSHLEASLQQDIDRLMQKIAESAGLVERGLRESVQALAGRKLQTAYMVILRDRRIDELEKQIDRLCLEFLVRQQPVAQHLRLAYVTIKINAELERIGDYAESIARQALKVARMDSLPCAEQFTRIAELSSTMLHQAAQSFLTQDPALARNTIQLDQQVDALRNTIIAELLDQLKKGQLATDVFSPLITVARRLERAADQSKNICEEVLYLCTGEFSKHRGNELLRVLFVDQDNSCRSQLAEAVGNSLDLSRLMFTSAGLEPKAVDPRTLQFLADKGLDTPRVQSKSIHQIPNLEHYEVIVLFTKEALKQLPPRPSKMVTFDWEVPDPSMVKGTEAEVRNAYEETYRYLREHIKELAEAILGNNNEAENKI